MRMSHRRRTGFTLVELIVVIGIVAILVALGVAAAIRVQNAQQVRSAQDVVEKVQVAVDKQYKAIVDQARTDIAGGRGVTPDAAAMLAYMGNDPDAAFPLLAYCRIRQSFPQTFSEVGAFTVGGFTFQVKAQFASFVGASDPTNNYYQQSALLLYAAVSQTGAGGQTFTAEATNSANKQFTLGTVTASAYMDAWQQPVGFCRFGTNPQLQAAPYVNANTASQGSVVAQSVDPLDPAGKLVLWTSSGIPNSGAATSAAYIFCGNGDIANATAFNGTNRRPVVYSIGPNGGYESLNQVAAPMKGKAPLDDILGYQLTQLGYKGTQ